MTRQRMRAAALVAEDALTNEQIAERCGVTRQALDQWKTRPEFRAEVGRLVAETRAALLAKGIADKQNRIDGYNDLYARLVTLIGERALDPIMADVAGGSTGLLVHRRKMLGGGPGARVVDEYEFDAAVPAEMRALAKQAAQELGEWTEKHDIKGDVLIREYEGFDPGAV